MSLPTFNGQEKIIPLQILNVGDSFGAIRFFTNDSRTINVRSKEFTTLLKVERTDFLNLLK